MPDLPHRAFAEEVTDRTGKPVDSYALKHVVQRDVGAYVSSRAVVAAAVAAGYRIVGKPTKAGNCWLALTVHNPQSTPGLA